MVREHAKAFLVVLLGAALGSAWVAAGWHASGMQKGWLDAAFVLSFLALGALAQPWMPAGLAGALAVAVLAGNLVADANSSVGDEENFAGDPAAILLAVVISVGVLVMMALVGHAVVQALRAWFGARPDAPRVAIKESVLACLVLLAGGVLGGVWLIAGRLASDGSGLASPWEAVILVALVMLLGAVTQPWLPPHLTGGVVVAFIAGQMVAWLNERGPDGEAMAQTPIVLVAAVLMVAGACGLALAVHWLVTLARPASARRSNPS